jgi:hypothetical protein
MSMRWIWPLGLGTGVVLVLAGCPPEDYGTLVPATLTQINRIHNDPNMPPWEMRSRLADLGLDAATINVVLSDKVLGNQFGGTLRTAYDKLTEPQYTALTPDEIQIFAIQASSVGTALNVQFNDDQAQAVAKWFRDNDLNSGAEVDAYLNVPGHTAPPGIDNGADTVRSLFVSFDYSLLLPKLP